MRYILDLLFGCRHNRTSFVRGNKSNRHITCLECGKFIPYSWEEMRRVK